MGLVFLTFPLWRWPGACEIWMWRESLIEHAKEALACPSGMDGYCEETGNCVHRNCGISGVGSRQSTVGSSPVVWWLELGAFTAVTWVQSVVEALRSCRLHGVAKNNKKKKKKGGGEIQHCWGSDQWQNPPTSWLSAIALLFPNVYFTFYVHAQVRTSLLAERKRWCDCICLKVKSTHCAMLPEAKQETAFLPPLLLIFPGPHSLAFPPGQPLDQRTSLWTCKKRNLVLIPQN